MDYNNFVQICPEQSPLDTGYIVFVFVATGIDRGYIVYIATPPFPVDSYREDNLCTGLGHVHFENNLVDTHHMVDYLHSTTLRTVVPADCQPFPT